MPGDFVCGLFASALAYLTWTSLGEGFIDWLKANFKWMFLADQASTSIGTAFVYDEQGSLLGEYDNGSATGKGRQEYIWLPTDDGQAIPIGVYKRGRFYAVHADHLGTPRLITDDDNKPVWQWPYSAFGNNKPTGVLKETPNPKAAITNQPVLLKAAGTSLDVNLRFPGQYFDEESNLSYNYFRSYNAAQGRYTQPDPIGMEGGFNRFAYANSSPLMGIDPQGKNAILLRIGEGLLIGATVWVVNSTTPAGRAANDALYNNVVEIWKNFCEPGDECKKAQNALLNKRLLISGMFAVRLLDIAEYRARALEFNNEVDVHNGRCPGFQVGRLPLGPQVP